MQEFSIDQRNSNRYRVMVKEPIGHTAYCFSTPIYNADTRKLVRTKFEKAKDGYLFRGSNGLVSIYQNRCVFETKGERVVILLNETPIVQGYEHCFKSKCNIKVNATLNGVRFVVKGEKFSLNLKSELKQYGIRFHSTSFSVMKDVFKPFLSVSALYARDCKGNFLPVEMKYQDNGNQNYDISFWSEIKDGSFVFEVNLYEPKLFQDTTVESLHTEANNAYGAIGFIGRTKQFGEQWLYSRPDFSKIPELTTERIERVFLHIPIFNESIENIDVFIPKKRFCSFGSTWKKKVDASNKITTSNNHGRYLTIDATPMFVSRTERGLVYNEGLILKKTEQKDKFIAISTGDCYSAPQILEIKLKN